MTGDASGSAYRFSVVFLLRVESRKDRAPYDTVFDRQFVNHALAELGRV